MVVFVLGRSVRFVAVSNPVKVDIKNLGQKACFLLLKLVRSGLNLGRVSAGRFLVGRPDDARYTGVSLCHMLPEKGIACLACCGFDIGLILVKLQFCTDAGDLSGLAPVDTKFLPSCAVAL